MALSSFRPNFWEAIQDSSGCLLNISSTTQKVWSELQKSNYVDYKSVDFSGEIFDTAFDVNVIIKGLDDTKLITLEEYSARNRTRHLKCKGKTCEDFTIMHLAWLEFSHYQLSVNFYGLTHKRYSINKLNFYVSHREHLVAKK